MLNFKFKFHSIEEWYRFWRSRFFTNGYRFMDILLSLRLLLCLSGYCFVSQVTKYMHSLSCWILCNQYGSKENKPIFFLCLECWYNLSAITQQANSFLSKPHVSCPLINDTLHDNYQKMAKHPVFNQHMTSSLDTVVDKGTYTCLKALWVKRSLKLPYIERDAAKVVSA